MVHAAEIPELCIIIMRTGSDTGTRRVDRKGRDDLPETISLRGVIL